MILAIPHSLTCSKAPWSQGKKSLAEISFASSEKRSASWQVTEQGAEVFRGRAAVEQHGSQIPLDLEEEIQKFEHWDHEQASLVLVKKLLEDLRGPLLDLKFPNA